MKMLLIATALAALPVQQEPARSPGPPTSAQFAAAKRALNERLLDYQSARFRDVHGTDMLICGFVNSKNRMGAYVGWTRFAWPSFSEEPMLLIDDADASDDIMLDAFCGEDGLRLQGNDYAARMAHR